MVGGKRIVGGEEELERRVERVGRTREGPAMAMVSGGDKRGVLSIRVRVRVDERLRREMVDGSRGREGNVES